MRVAVFSDSHNETEPMLHAIRELKPDLVLHLGDHARDAQALRAQLPGLDIRCVRGNCDWGSGEPEVLTPVLEGVKIFMTHGHRYHVKETLTPLLNAAHFSGAALALFGHTHQLYHSAVGGVTLFNPGAAGARGTGGLVIIEGGNIQCRRIDL